MVTGCHGITGLLAVSVVVEELETEEENVYDLGMVVKTAKVVIMKQRNVTSITVQVSTF